MITKFTTADLKTYLSNFVEQELSISDMMTDLHIPKEKQQSFRMLLSRLVNDKETRLLKATGSRSGLYRVLKPVTVIKKFSTFIPEPISLIFPSGKNDNSSFGFEELVEIDEGDVVVIAGVSNSAKTAWVINMLAENMDNMPCVLMGNEYARADNQLSPKFERRLQRMDWANWTNGDGEFKFDIIPVAEDYEEWVKPGCLNFIDWINLTENFYTIGKIIKDIKHNTGTGVSVIVIQKGEDNLLGRGKDFTRDLADFYVTIDPMRDKMTRRLTVIKAKAPKQFMDGRMWAFQILNFGTTFSNIREIVICKKCWGKGYTKSGNCEFCHELGYVEK